MEMIGIVIEELIEIILESDGGLMIENIVDVMDNDRGIYDREYIG